MCSCRTGLFPAVLQVVLRPGMNRVCMRSLASVLIITSPTAMVMALALVLKQTDSVLVRQCLSSSAGCNCGSCRAVGIASAFSHRVSNDGCRELLYLCASDSLWCDVERNLCRRAHGSTHEPAKLLRSSPVRPTQTVYQSVNASAQVPTPVSEAAAQ